MRSSWKSASQSERSAALVRQASRPKVSAALRDSQQRQMKIDENLFVDSSGTVSVSVRDPHVVGQGGDEHTEYVVVVNNSSGLWSRRGEWTLSTRFSQVWELRETLVEGRYYTDEELPSLEKKWADRFKGNVVQKRCYNFQVLLEFLVLRPVQTIAPPVVVFLTPPTVSVSIDADTSSEDELVALPAHLRQAPSEEAAQLRHSSKQVLPIRPVCAPEVFAELRADLVACTFPLEREGLLRAWCRERVAEGLYLRCRDAARLLEDVFVFPREKLGAALILSHVLADPRNDFLLREKLYFAASAEKFQEEAQHHQL